MEDKAMPITDLVSYFEKNGNGNSRVVCDDNTPSFSPEDWKNFSEEEKEKIMTQYTIGKDGKVISKGTGKKPITTRIAKKVKKGVKDFKKGFK